MTGLVVEGVPSSPRQRYVWCKERPAGNELIVENKNYALKLGQWIKLHVSQQEFEEFFPSETFENGQYPWLLCNDYTEIDDVYPTERTSSKQKPVSLNMTVTSNDAHEVLTPFLGSSKLVDSLVWHIRSFFFSAYYQLYPINQDTIQLLSPGQNRQTKTLPVDFGC